MDKYCSKCRLVKDITSFPKDSKKKDGAGSCCKSCKSTYNKEYRLKNIENNRIKNAEWHEANKDRARKNRSNYYYANKTNILNKRKQLYSENPLISKSYDLKKLYGITIEDYNELLNKQGHSCAICKAHKDEFIKALAVDHCHKTGRVRGLLCINCNRALGNLKDSVISAKNVVTYLEST